MTTRSVILATAILMLSFPFTTQAQSRAEGGPTTTLEDAAIVDIASDQSSLTVRYKCETLAFSVAESALRSGLKVFGPGDQVRLNYVDEAGKKTLKGISVRKCVPSSGATISALLVAAALLLITLLIFLGRGIPALFVGADNRYSNSKFQMALWFLTLIVGYLGVSFLRVLYGGAQFAGGVGIPQNLLLLSGLSAFTFASAKAIVNGQLDRRELVKTRAQKPKLSDLVQDDEGHVDVGDFQMLLLTLVAVVTYLAQIYGFVEVINLHKKVTLPDVDTTILASFGLGQGAYLMKKYVGQGKDEKKRVEEGKNENAGA